MEPTFTEAMQCRQHSTAPDNTISESKSMFVIKLTYWLGIGADACCTAVLVENCAPYGLLITNGQFVAFHGPDPTNRDRLTCRTVLADRQPDLTVLADLELSYAEATRGTVVIFLNGLTRRDHHER